MFRPTEDSATAMLLVVCYKNFTRFTSWQLLLQTPAANHSNIHLHVPFPIADSHARTPKSLILQAFTMGFEVSFFVVWPCQKPRVSVLRRFCTGAFLVSWFPFVGGRKVQVGNSLHGSTHGSSIYTGRREVQLQFNPVQFSLLETFFNWIHYSTFRSFTFNPMELDNAKTAISRKSTFSVLLAFLTVLLLCAHLFSYGFTIVIPVFHSCHHSCFHIDS